MSKGWSFPGFNKVAVLLPESFVPFSEDLPLRRPHLVEGVSPATLYLFYIFEQLCQEDILVLRLRSTLMDRRVFAHSNRNSPPEFSKILYL